MFEHLNQFDPEIDTALPQTLSSASADEMLAAQVQTTEWLTQMGAVTDDELEAELSRKAARTAFTALAVPNPQTLEAKAALASVKTPEAVRHLTGMLSAYDWEFVAQAKQLRGFATAKILEETSHPDARIRLKALDMLGKITEVALFTERVEVTKIDASEEELNRRLQERLSKYLTPSEGASVTDVTPVAITTPTTDA